MGRVAAAGDNAAMESFFARSKERARPAALESRDELRYAIVTWIEHNYNRRRRQRTLGKLTPVEYELAFASEEALAA
jgi:putative transposase